MSDKGHFYISKTFNAAESVIVRMLAPVTGNLIRTHVKSDVVLSGGNALFDVNVNGTTVWSDQTQRLKILDTAQSGDKSGLSAAVTEFDEITVDFDGFTGTATQVGNRLALILEFEASGGGGGSPLGAMVKLTSAQTINNDEPDPEAVQWDDNGEIVRDDGGFAQIADNIFLIPSGLDGWYTITYQARWEGNATGQRRLEIVLQDDTEAIVLKAQKNEVSLGTTDTHYMQVSLTYYMPEGWSVYFRQWQNSGGDLDIESTNDETWFAIVPAGKG